MEVSGGRKTAAVKGATAMDRGAMALNGVVIGELLDESSRLIAVKPLSLKPPLEIT